MKALKILAFSSIVFLLQGCYTVIWTPDIDLPTKDTSENSDSYYEEPYYGEYYPYYENPWWYSLPPATYSPRVKPRGPLVEKVRETGTTDRPTERPRQPDNRIPDAGSPTVSQPTTTTTTTTTDDSSAKRTESSSTPSRERTTSTNSRDTRNNDGSRSSDPPRR